MCRVMVDVQDTFLAKMYAGMRTLRLADGALRVAASVRSHEWLTLFGPAPHAFLVLGPDEVHLRSIAFMELRGLVGKGNLRARL